MINVIKKLFIKNWLNKYGIKNYIINQDLTVDVNGDVDLHRKKLEKLEVQFNKIYGNFNCSHNLLISLKGSPREVNGYFDCSYNYLSSLKGSPYYVRQSMLCCHNSLKSLEDGPYEIGGSFFCTSRTIFSIDTLVTKFDGRLIFSNTVLKLKEYEPYSFGETIIMTYYQFKDFIKENNINQPVVIKQGKFKFT